MNKCWEIYFQRDGLVTFLCFKSENNIYNGNDDRDADDDNDDNDDDDC
jgi:hypothetical protein